MDELSIVISHVMLFIIFTVTAFAFHVSHFTFQGADVSIRYKQNLINIRTIRQHSVNIFIQSFLRTIILRLNE